MTDRLETLQNYSAIRTEIVALLNTARTASARSVNALMTATYWEIGRRIVEFEQQGQERAEYGEALIKQLAADLTRQFGRGFGAVNLSQMRRFYLAWPPPQIFQTPSEKSLAHQKHRAVAKVAAARKLAIRLYWMLRTQTPYPQVVTSRAA